MPNRPCGQAQRAQQAQHSAAAGVPLALARQQWPGPLLQRKNRRPRQGGERERKGEARHEPATHSCSHPPLPARPPAHSPGGCAARPASPGACSGRGARPASARPRTRAAKTPAAPPGCAPTAALRTSAPGRGAGGRVCHMRRCGSPRSVVWYTRHEPPWRLVARHKASPCPQPPPAPPQPGPRARRAPCGPGRGRWRAGCPGQC